MNLNCQDKNVKELETILMNYPVGYFPITLSNIDHKKVHALRDAMSVSIIPVKFYYDGQTWGVRI
jgi:hypothetical protein